MKHSLLSQVMIFVIVGSSAVLSGAEFEVKNEAEFKKIVSADAKVEKLAGEMQFIEGPVWDDAGGFLIFSDIPRNELKKWTQSGGLTTFRKPSNKINGNTLDRDGKVISAEHGARRVSRTEKSGEVLSVVESYQDKKLNSPNDVVVKSDGTIWFTDPDYGLEGRPKEQEANHVFRFDPATKTLTAVVKDFNKPNGLCFSPDERLLYVADSGSPRHIRVFEVDASGNLNAGKVFAKIDKGGPDGIRCDEAGRIWSSAGDGVHIFATDGSLIGKILVPESPANLAFGGRDGKQLYIAARSSLYTISTSVTGAKRP